MSYNDNMSNEQPPKRKVLLNQGWRIFQFKSGKEATSKSGNSMFIMQIEDNETNYIEDIYLVRTPGKRWVLKCILNAFDIKKDDSDNYSYEISDLINKDICGLVIHEPNEYINRAGETIKTTQHKIIEFKKFEPTNINGKQVGNPGGITDPKDIDIAWEE